MSKDRRRKILRCRANAISVQVFPFFLDLLSNVPLLRLSAKISATRSLIDQLFSNLPLNIIHHPPRVSFNTSLPIQLDVTSVWNDVQSGLSDNSKVFDCKIIFSHAILDRSQPFLIRTSGKYHSQAGSTNAIRKSVCFDNFNIGQAYMER